MADASAILTAFREELIEAGLGRRPSQAGILTPVHIEPRDGAPAPGEREAPEDDAALVISLFASGELAEDNYDAATRRRLVIDVRYRTTGSSAGLRAAMALDAAIRARLIRPATNYGYGFTLGSAAAIPCYQAALWGGFGPIRAGDYVGKWLIETSPD